MEKKIYFDDSYFDKIEEQKKIDNVDNQQMSDKDELNKKNYIKFIHADNEDIKVSPVRGYGNKVESVKVFEKKYRFYQYEWGLLTTDTSYPNIVVEGTVRSVTFDTNNAQGLYDGNFRNVIMSHVHPPKPIEEDYEYVTLSTNTDTGHSIQDIANFISSRPFFMEDRVVNRFSTYVFQKPKMGWNQWEKIYPEFGSQVDDNGEVDGTYEKMKPKEVMDILGVSFEKSITKWSQYFLDLYDIDETYLPTDEQIKDAEYRKEWINNESYHIALTELSKKYKLPYARYNDYTMNSKKLTVKERKQIKGMKFIDTGIIKE